LCGRIKEAAHTLRKQDPTLYENRALNKYEGALTGCEFYNYNPTELGQCRIHEA